MPDGIQRLFAPLPAAVDADGQISVLNGAIARYGARLGVPTPFNTVITQVISCIQNNYDKQYLG